MYISHIHHSIRASLARINCFQTCTPSLKCSLHVYPVFRYSSSFSPLISSSCFRMSCALLSTAVSTSSSSSARNGRVSGSSTMYSSLSLSTSEATTSRARQRVRADGERVAMSTLWLSGFQCTSLLVAMASCTSAATVDTPYVSRGAREPSVTRPSSSLSAHCAATAGAADAGTSTESWATSGDSTLSTLSWSSQPTVSYRKQRCSARTALPRATHCSMAASSPSVPPAAAFFCFFLAGVAAPPVAEDSRRTHTSSRNL
mmetsp:Transcript_36517/g.92220  ORF Transcript_36517/g.92220 Transcript_36517/m.92220 type:complete len:259 (-) Transcript_36517:508-1284(-)